MRAVLAFACLTALAGSLRAQCADGSPPPCRGAAAAARRPAPPPLDDRTWIVLPFDNLARRDDMEWLRDASVNLLYMDMSRWRDIRVVDDERVADLLRSNTDARGATRLSLNTGLAVARSAGAGRLVMGDLITVGSRTQVVAKVFDVRQGRRIRDVTEATPFADSIIPLFGRVAKGVLNVAPPAGEKLGAIGTARIDAYQEYVAGIKALNRFDLTQAQQHFRKSLALDSTFALAHHKLAQTLGWLGVPNRMYMPNVEAASRLGGALPQRERRIINGLRLHSIGDYAGACEQFGSLVRADSSDVEALYGLGDCLFHDEAVVPANADSSQWRFRGSWNESIAVFRRILTLDPTFHIAFQHILDALKSESRGGCLRQEPEKPCSASLDPARAFLAIIRRDADTLLADPVRAAALLSAQAQRNEAIRTNAAKQNLEQARRIAEDWIAQAPDEIRPRVELAQLLLLLGRLDDAERQLAAIAPDKLASIELGRALIARYEIAVKKFRGAEANRVLDSLTQLGGVTGAPQQIRVYVAVLNTIAGRATFYDSILMPAVMPPDVKRYLSESVRVLLGFPGDSAIAVERRVAASILSMPPPFTTQAAALLQSTLTLGVRIPRREWPAVVLDSKDTTFAIPKAAATGDTAALRAAVRKLDSLALTPVGRADPGVPVVAADIHVMLGDSLRALELVRTMLDSILPQVPFVATLSSGFGGFALVYPRAMRQRAELAAALGYTDEARLWYGRLLDLWAKADPEFQDELARIRAAYRALGG